MDDLKQGGFYTSSSRENAKAVIVNAKKIKEEIQLLHRSVGIIFDEESAKNPKSEEAKLVTQVYTSSKHALNYFTCLCKGASYPTDLNSRLKLAAETSQKITVCLLLFATAVSWTQKFARCAAISWTVSFVACAFFSGIDSLNDAFRIQPAIRELKNLHSSFENSIGLIPEGFFEKDAV